MNAQTINTAAQFSCDTLITADLIVTQDVQRRVVEKAALAVKDGLVLAVGGQDELAGAVPQKRLDLGRALVLPGLVNAHTHVAMTLFRGLADDLPLMEWLTGHIFPREQHLTAEIVELGALLGCAEMIRTGTTAFADMYLFEESVARAADKAGLRCLLGEAVFAFPTPASASVEQAFDRIRDLAATYANHPRLRVAVMPHTVYTTTPEILADCLALADELQLPMQMHLSETRTEVEACLEKFGKRPVAYCQDLGLLRPGMSLAHCVVLEADEIDVLAACGAHVVHNPRSNMKLASGVAPVPALMDRGASLALGTDGPASNNSLNMFAEMGSCALLHKVTALEPTLCPAQSVLDMATLGGAAALGMAGLGRLAPGCPADLAALDLTSPNLLPLYNPVSHLVYAASGHEVTLTMAGGDVLYKDGKLAGLDEQALLAEAARLAAWVRARL